MKTLATLSLVSIFSSSIAFAGGFGGPGPFRNDSPLPTGTDGTYNASLRGSNTSGIFRFSLSAGTQSADIAPANPIATNPGIYSGRNNSWIAWYEGVVYRGLTDAAIIEGKVSGVLDVMLPPNTQVSPPNNASQGTTTISTTVPANPLNPQPGQISTAPYTIARLVNLQQPPPVPSNNSLVGGQFTGSINLKSPTGNMSGNGSFVVVEDTGNIQANGEAKSSNDPQFVAKEVKFRWRGARVNTGN